MDDGHAIDRFVEMALEAPVDQQNRGHEGPRCFLGIRLDDGTSVVRAFWLETGELSRGIMTDPVVTLSVWRKIPDEHRPVGMDGGPRISERLAGRLGLAHLSFNYPGLNVTGKPHSVTGKPHSPTARLMRRSEFDAMQGGIIVPGNPGHIGLGGGSPGFMAHGQHHTDGDALPVPNGEASGLGSRSTGAPGWSSIRHPAYASGFGNPKSMRRRTSIENARNATAGDPHLGSNWSLPRREV